MQLGPFLAVAAIVVITPGVDMAVVTRNALMHGRRAAVMTAFGINVGILFWVRESADYALGAEQSAGLPPRARQQHSQPEDRGLLYQSPASVRRHARLGRQPASARTAIQRDGSWLAHLLCDRRSTRTERPRSTARQAHARSNQRPRARWARHTPRARKPVGRWRDDRTDPPTADPQPQRARVRLRPRLLVQTYCARPRGQVVVPRALLRPPPQESRPRALERAPVPVGATHCLQLPAGKLRGPRSEIGARRSGQATFECCFLPRSDRLRGFDVESRRDSSRPALVGYAGDLDRAFHRADRHLHRVPDADLLRRLHACAVDVDASAEHCVRSGATGLEEPRRPQPLVDPRPFHP